MSLLVDRPLVGGLRYAEELIGCEQEQQLVGKLEALELSPFRFQRWTANRKTMSFGWRYDFADSSFTPAPSIPEWLEDLRQRAAGFAGLSPQDFVHILLARYDPGAGIGWHRDRDLFEVVVGISLGAPATLRFRRRTATGFTRASLALAPRSAYLLSGESRSGWEHRITPGDDLRFSITLRSLSEKGRRIAAAQR